MILSIRYPNKETNKEIIATSLIVGILLYFLLIIYQPFGTSLFEHSHKYLLLLAYAVISSFSFCSINLLASRKKGQWTVGSELLKTFFILLLISSLSYFYNTLFLSKVGLSFENYLYMFSYTSALVAPVMAIYILARYIYLNRSSRLRGKMTEDDALSGRGIEINEDQFKICIVSDSSGYTLEMKQEDFIYAESADNYCMIHFYNNGNLRKELVRISLTRLLSQIQTNTIKRVHRSFIVNLKMVTGFKGNSSGYRIFLSRGDQELMISRSYIDIIVPILENLAIRP